MDESLRKLKRAIEAKKSAIYEELKDVREKYDTYLQNILGGNYHKKGNIVTNFNIEDHFYLKELLDRYEIAEKRLQEECFVKYVTSRDHLMKARIVKGDHVVKVRTSTTKSVRREHNVLRYLEMDLDRSRGKDNEDACRKNLQYAKLFIKNYPTTPCVLNGSSFRVQRTFYNKYNQSTGALNTKTTYFFPNSVEVIDSQRDSAHFQSQINKDEDGREYINSKITGLDFSGNKVFDSLVFKDFSQEKINELRELEKEGFKKLIGCFKKE